MIKTMAQTAPPKHVAEDYYIGNTHVVVAEDYCCNQTDDEAAEIVKRCEQIYINSVKR